MVYLSDVKFDASGIIFMVAIFSILLLFPAIINDTDDKTFDYYNKNIKNKDIKSTLKSPKYNKDTFKTYNEQLKK